MNKVYRFEQIAPLIAALGQIMNGKSASMRTFDQILTNTDMALMAKKALDEFEKSRLEEIEPIEEGKGEEENGWDWVPIFYGALRELVELKQIKDEQGKTEEYLQRKTAAWHSAFQAMYLWDKSDCGAKPLPTKEADKKQIESGKGKSA